MGHRDVKKVSVVEGWKEGRWARWRGRKRAGQRDGRR